MPWTSTWNRNHEIKVPRIKDGLQYSLGMFVINLDNKEYLGMFKTNLGNI